MLLSPKAKKTISITVKTAILTLAFYFIYRKLGNNKSLADFWGLIQGMGLHRVWYLLTTVFLLLFVNWLLEAVKWKFLVSKVEEISSFKAVESVFCGLTWAVFTPNRIGEYGGRVFFLQPDKRGRGIVAMTVGSAGQIVLTNVLGGIGLIWFIHRFFSLTEWVGYAITFIIILFCLFIIIFFFNIQLLNNLLQRIPLLRSLRHYFEVFTYYTTGDLVRVFILSLSRFAVFTFQYYLVIHLLVPSLAAHEIVLMVFIILFVQSSIPSVNLLDVGVRGITATYFFGYLTNQDIAILAASACIWLVNLIIPAILGAGFVLKLRFFGHQYS
jgi:uncharacterized membrane protein YbhN (UPF0104 family)